MADSENSNFKTSVVENNEIVKAVDFNFGFESLVNNINYFSRMVLDVKRNFVIGGKVTAAGGMTVQVAPIFGINKDLLVPFGSIEDSDPISIETSSTEDRIDIIEVTPEWVTYDNQQRGYNDLDSGTITYQMVDTKKRLKCSFLVKKGTSALAPEVDEGYVKLCEIHYTKNATEIDDDDIFNISADIPDMENTNWSNEKTSTYNIGYISDVNSKFRKEHNADGTHADKVIHSNNIDFGTSSNQVNGSKIAKGGNDVTMGETTLPAASSTSEIVNLIASEFNKGKFQSISSNLSADTWFKISAPEKADTINLIADNGEEVVITYSNKTSSTFAWNSKAVKLLSGNNLITALKMDSNNNLYVKVSSGCLKFMIQSENALTVTSTQEDPLSSATEIKLLTLERDTTVTENSSNLVTSGAVYETKKSLSGDISASNTRIKALEDSKFNEYSNKVFSRFSPVENKIDLVATENITLYGEQTIDSVLAAAGMLILVIGQTDKTKNGVWVASSTNWVRNQGTIDYSTFESIENKLFVIKNGETYKNYVFYSPNTNSGSLGTEEVEFVNFVKFATQLLKDESVTSDKLASDLTLKGETKGTFKGTLTGNVTGNLNGNADSSTNAECDENGDNIADNYAKIENATNRRVITGYLDGTTAYFYTYGE